METWSLQDIKAKKTSLKDFFLAAPRVDLNISRSREKEERGDSIPSSRQGVMPMDDPAARREDITRLRSLLQGRGEITLAILFGSLAEGRARLDSDADLAVAGPEVLTYEQLLDISLEAGKVLGREVQVRDLRRLGGTILSQVLVKGIRLKNLDPRLLGELTILHLDFQTDVNPSFQKAREASLKEYFHG